LPGSIGVPRKVGRRLLRHPQRGEAFAAAARSADVPKRGAPPSNPLMHRTRTVDYAIVISGEIDMLLDAGPVHLKAGDVIVQQATNQAWLNHGKQPCRIALVLMDS
jgi:hypothetical protein